jgi:hypothetical protein
MNKLSIYVDLKCSAICVFLYDICYPQLTLKCASQYTQVCNGVILCVCNDAWQKVIPCLVVQEYSARCLLLNDICNKNLKCKPHAILLYCMRAVVLNEKSLVSKCIKLKLLIIDKQAKHLSSSDIFR